eukprot:TRINITY_DN1369_c0_g1_i1.p1 TRINITY_DN1369_c0_g1~~TRINITY_DN1369_c0_g1_i1.p1  ORF type:complete len:230 (+),score=81.80 TRINITY_DN1369_c0_g1_i1:87-692(+)
MGIEEDYDVDADFGPPVSRGPGSGYPSATRTSSYEHDDYGASHSTPHHDPNVETVVVEVSEVSGPLGGSDGGAYVIPPAQKIWGLPYPVLFHFVSICCALLSLILWFPMFIPGIWIFVAFKNIIRYGDKTGMIMCGIDLLVTALCGIIVTLTVVACAVFTYGICLVGLLCILPFMVVGMVCTSSLTGKHFSVFDGPAPGAH